MSCEEAERLAALYREAEAWRALAGSWQRVAEVWEHAAHVVAAEPEPDADTRRAESRRAESWRAESWRQVQAVEDGLRELVDLPGTPPACLEFARRLQRARGGR